MNLFTSYKNYLPVVIFFTAIVVILAFFIYLPLHQIQDASSQLELNRNKDAVWAQESSEIEKFKQSYKENKANLERFSAMFVDPADPIDFIKFLETTANASQIVSTIVIAPVVPGKADSSRMNFSIQAKGSFSDMVIFTQRLESGPYLVNIQSTTFARPEESTQKDKTPPNQIQATFSINVVAK